MSPGNYPQQLRIIGGKWRGRQFPIPTINGLRPTPNRVRETLFNWLGQKIVHSRCLDPFAGSGAMGLEALSRGAKWVTLIDNDPQVIKHLKTSLTLAGEQEYQIIHDSATNYLQQKHSQTYDIVFMDPPFNENLIGETCQLLEKSNWLADCSLIYVEHERRLSDLQVPANWTLEKEKKAGKVCYKLYSHLKYTHSV